MAGPKARASSNPSPSSNTAELVRPLEDWYRAEARDLPWRRTQDPYAIWISEAMLQQTRVEAVKDYWVRFLERFPTVESLAEADEEAVLEKWSGLGYYRRARNLQAAARVLVAEHGGEFPRSRAAALSLPGVGPYTAGAVLSIAYGLPEPLVDGNVERVFARFFGIEEVAASPALKARAWQLAQELMPVAKEPRDWNQALMELGATVCTPRAPRCLLCPVQPHCLASEGGDPGRLPLPKPRKKPTPVAVRVMAVVRDGQILLEQRPKTGRMAGLWQLPTCELPTDGTVSILYPLNWAAGLKIEVGEAFGEFSHAITRFSVRATVHHARLLSEPLLAPLGPYRWTPVDQAASLAISGMAKKSIDLLPANGSQ